MAGIGRVFFPTFSRAAIEDSVLRIVGNQNLVSHGEDDCGAWPKRMSEWAPDFAGVLRLKPCMGRLDDVRQMRILYPTLIFIVALGCNA